MTDIQHIVEATKNGTLSYWVIKVDGKTLITGDGGMQIFKDALRKELNKTTTIIVPPQPPIKGEGLYSLLSKSTTSTYKTLKIEDLRKVVGELMFNQKPLL